MKAAPVKSPHKVFFVAAYFPSLTSKKMEEVVWCRRGNKAF